MDDKITPRDLFAAAAMICLGVGNELSRVLGDEADILKGVEIVEEAFVAANAMMKYRELVDD